MDLILEVRTGRGRVTLACQGRLIGGKEAEAFRRSAVLLLGGFDRLVIHLAGVRDADFGGLSSLASVLELAEKKGKQVRILHPSPAVLATLESCGLSHLFRPLSASFRTAAAPMSGPSEAFA